MNYMVYHGGQSLTITLGPVAVNTPSGQQTIVLTPPSQSSSSTCNNTNNNNNNNHYPVMMQVPGSNPAVFYTYQNEKNGEISGTGMTGMNQVMLSHVQSGTPTVNIHADSKSNAAMSIGDVYNVQAVPAIPSGPGIVSSGSVPKDILTSLQAAGLQIVENSSTNTGNTHVNVAAVSNPNIQTADMNADKGAMANFMTSLQSSGLHVVENNNEQTLSISLPNTHVDESKFRRDGTMLPNPVSGENVYKVIDRTGNLALVTTGLPNERLQEQCVKNFPVPSVPSNQLSTRYYAY